MYRHNQRAVAVGRQSSVLKGDRERVSELDKSGAEAMVGNEFMSD